MRTFALLVRAGFRRHSTYRLALLAGMTTNSVFGLIRASVLVAAVTSAGTQIGGYDAPKVLAFVWWGQALLGAVNLWGFQEVGDRVRTGDIAIDFLRPLNPQLTYLAGDLGRAGINLILRGAPALLIGALLYDLAAPPGLDSWVLGLVSVVIAVVVAFAATVIVNLLAFWVRRQRGTTLLLTTHDMGDIERLCDRVLVVDHGRLAFDGTLQGLAATVGAERLLVIDLARPTPPLEGVPHARLVDSEPDGLRQRLAFDATQTTAAAVLADVSSRAEVRDLTIEEPNIEDVVRRIYATSRDS